MLPVKVLTPEAEGELRSFSTRFAAALPPNSHASGHYTAIEGDRYGEYRFAAPNGSYRVVGADWVLVIRKNKFVSAHRAVPPSFGGKDVVAVPNG